VIETRQLSKYYGRLCALDRLDLELEKGDLFGFVGPNGAGKTTTMNILATLLIPTSGTASVCGYSVHRDGEKIRRVVGYMPDFLGVYDDLTVHEYLEFFGAAYGLARRERMRVINDGLDLTDVTYKRDAMVSSLSRGMTQRLGVARVLIHDPQVLILDEPASGLDPRARIEMRELFKELRNLGKTIMLSSHILSELHEMCNKVGILEQGKLVFFGTLDDVKLKLGVHGRVRIRVEADAERASQLLARLPDVAAVEQQDGELIVTRSENSTSNAPLAAALVHAGIPIDSITPQEIKLEEAFMQLTEGLVQ
jgi:ABC-2 type transport system ATP-binding protein